MNCNTTHYRANSSSVPGDPTVAGFSYEGLFAHRWYIGCDDNCAMAGQIRQVIDETLSEINDDYAVERTSALKEIFVEVLPNQVFYDYLRYQGKEGAMNKFPRVIKGRQLEEWEAYLKEQQVKPFSVV